MGRRKTVRAARKRVVDRGDPLASVLSFGRRAVRVGLVIGVVVASISHGLFAGRALLVPTDMRLWAEAVQKEVHDYLWSTYDVELASPPPAPEEKKDDEKEEAQEEDSKPAPTPKPVPVAAFSPPPPAAQAGKVLTARSDPDAPVDLTGDGFVTGDAESFVGGVTAAAGTGTVATNNAAASTSGKPGGTGTGAAVKVVAKPTGPDKSRAATFAMGTNWSSCPFPPEANTDQVDHAVVTLIVTVRPDGTPRSVQVVSDPGHGFGRAARMCALSKRYATALDRDGNPVMGTTPPIRVRFTR